MLEISLNTPPSFLHPKSPAIPFETINASRCKNMFKNVGRIRITKATISTTPMLVLRYSTLAPAVFKVSPTVEPTTGINWLTNILVVFVVKLSAREASMPWVDITVVKTITD